MFSNVGAAGLSAIAAISSSWRFMPASKAGAKSPSWILSNGGASNGNGLFVRSGFARTEERGWACWDMRAVDQVEKKTAPNTTAPARP